MITINYEESLKRAEEISFERDSDVNIDLSINTFITEYYQKHSQAYGHGICGKIIHDSNGALVSCHPDFGDAVSTNTINKVFYEVKSSYSGKNGKFNITHIRDYQNFNYFILCFVDRKDKFKQYYYMITKDFICKNFKMSNMDGTKKSNENNKEINKRMSISKEDALYYFGNANVLADSSYETLQNFLKSNEEDKLKFINPNFNDDYDTLKHNKDIETTSLRIDKEKKKKIEEMTSINEKMVTILSTEYKPTTYKSLQKQYMTASGYLDYLNQKKPGRSLIASPYFKQYDSGFNKARSWKKNLNKV